MGLHLGDSLRTIGTSAFEGCTGLVDLHLPSSVQTIERNAFRGCTGLVGLHLGDSLQTIGDCAFRDCTGLVDLAFYRCSAVSGLHRPASVATVKGSAFKGCTALETVVMESIKVQFTLYAFTFSGCTSLAAISVPDPDHAMSTWPHDTMFQKCTKQLHELLEGATPDMQLRYYWKPGAGGHALCLTSARKAVVTVLLIAARLMHRWRAGTHNTAEHGQSPLTVPRVGLQTRPLFPDLPDELWFYILRLIRRHELGGALA